MAKLSCSESQFFIIFKCSFFFLSPSFFLTFSNDELHILYWFLNTVRVIKSKRLRWAGHVARMKKGRSAFKMLTGTPTGTRPLGRPRRRWEDNIKMDLKEIGANTRNWVDWIDVKSINVKFLNQICYFLNK